MLAGCFGRSRAAVLTTMVTAMLVGQATVLASPSQAAYGICPFNDWGRACVYNGQAKVSDDLPDGHSTLVQWQYGARTTTYSLWDSNGADNGFVYKFVYTGNRTNFRSRLCIGESSDRRILRCDSWV